MLKTITTAAAALLTAGVFLGAATGPAFAGDTATHSVHGWSKKVEARLNDALTYPAAGYRHEEHGTAEVKLTIAPSGRIISAELASSSGSALLDKQALRTVAALNPLPAMPASEDAQRTVLMRMNFGVAHTAEQAQRLQQAFDSATPKAAQYAQSETPNLN